MTTYLSELDTARYDALTCALHRSADPVTVLSDLVALLAGDMPQADAVTLTHSPTGRNPRYLAAVSEGARAVDELQVRCQQGPLLDAVECLEPLVSGDLHADQRWPRIAALLQRQGSPVRSAWIAKLCGDTGIVLAFYANTPDAFDDAALQVAGRAAAYAHPVLDHFHSFNRATNLSVALETSRQIGAAMGVLMASRKITEQQAFDLLRSTSQQLHRKVRDVAAEVIETGALPARPVRTDRTPRAVRAPRVTTRRTVDDRGPR